MSNKGSWRASLEKERSICMAECLGCANEFLIEDMNPVLDEHWVCKVCYRNELEGIE